MALVLHPEQDEGLLMHKACTIQLCALVGLVVMNILMNSAGWHTAMRGNSDSIEIELKMHLVLCVYLCCRGCRSKLASRVSPTQACPGVR